MQIKATVGNFRKQEAKAVQWRHQNPRNNRIVQTQTQAMFGLRSDRNTKTRLGNTSTGIWQNECMASIDNEMMINKDNTNKNKTESPRLLQLSIQVQPVWRVVLYFGTAWELIPPLLSLSPYSIFPLVVLTSASDFPECIFVVASGSSADSKPSQVYLRIRSNGFTVTLWNLWFELKRAVQWILSILNDFVSRNGKKKKTLSKNSEKTWEQRVMLTSHEECTRYSFHIRTTQGWVLLLVLGNSWWGRASGPMSWQLPWLWLATYFSVKGITMKLGFDTLELPGHVIAE